MGRHDVSCLLPKSEQTLANKLFFGCVVFCFVVATFSHCLVKRLDSVNVSMLMLFDLVSVE